MGVAAGVSTRWMRISRRAMPPSTSRRAGRSKTSARHSRYVSTRIGKLPYRLATPSRSAARWRCCQSGVREPGRRRGRRSARAAFSRKRAAKRAEPPTAATTRSSIASGSGKSASSTPSRSPSGRRTAIPSSDQIEATSWHSRSRRRASIASDQGAWTRPPNGVRRTSRQSPSSSRKRSTTTRRSVGRAPAASRSSSRYATRFSAASASRWCRSRSRATTASRPAAPRVRSPSTSRTKAPSARPSSIGRPIELGRALGAFVRDVEGDLTRGAAGREAVVARLRERHHLDALAAENLVAYLEDEREAAGALPTDRRVVVERFRDELGDWRLVLLTPFGGRVHAPWSLAIEARLRERLGQEVASIWSDDGIAVRLPECDLDGVEEALFPDPEAI